MRVGELPRSHPVRKPSQSGAVRYRFVIALLVLGVVLLAGWRFFFYHSDVDRGLEQLRAAYKGRRPTESRTTAGFDFAPFRQLRGSDASTQLTDQKAFNTAELLTLKAAGDHSARSYQALGLVKLAAGKTDEALTDLNTAAGIDARDAAIHSDLGAAYLESAMATFSRNDSAAGTILLEKSLASLETALEIDPDLKEAKFNRAVCLERSMLQEGAKLAWRDFIDSDPDSGWANEARQHIEDINARNAQNLKDTEVVSRFLALFRERDNANAALLIGNNRELILSKYVPQALAFSLTAPKAERSTYIEALQYAGEIEQNSIGDPFASELARYYAGASDSDIATNEAAHKLVRKGYVQARNEQYEPALANFVTARASFLKVRNTWEASLSGVMMAYCLTQLDKMKESIALSGETARFAKEHRYRWLHATVLFWYSIAQKYAGDRAGEKANLQLGLDTALEIRDPSLTQLILMAYARKFSYTGLHPEALKNLREAFVTGDAGDASRRQRWRNYSDGSEILANAGLFTLAKAVSRENDRLIADDPGFGSAVYTKIDAAIVYSRSGALEEAEKWLADARNAIPADTDEVEKRSVLAKTSLESGYIALKRGDFARAAGFYDEAYSYIRNAETPRELFEIQKGRLFSYAPGGDDQKIEQQVVTTLRIAEKYRKDLPSLDDFSETFERIRFFDNQQAVYDIAVTNNYAHGRLAEAYKYLEMSNSRALLSWLQKTVSVKSEFTELEGSFGAEPLGLDEVRARMPAQSQVLQYAVLDDRILIWVFSRTDLFVTSVNISRKDLDEKLTAYLDAIDASKNGDRAQADAISRELYTLLVAPVAPKLQAGKQVCVVPHKSLFRLPFATLLDGQGEPFIKSYELTYSPSANVFLLFSDLAGRKAKAPEERLLAVGNPAFDRKEFPKLPDLENAGEEVNGILPFYARPIVFANKTATKDAFSRNLGNAEVIHFAGHYVVRPGEPLNSGMLLAKGDGETGDGIMTNRELTHLALPRAKLVVLAGCETGGEEVYNGEGMFGLSRTFLAAGVPLVVASQWPVDSKSTMKLMKKFHFYRRAEKLPTAAALRKAQLDMYAEPNGLYNSPYYWGAFTLFGGYAEF